MIPPKDTSTTKHINIKFRCIKYLKDVVTIDQQYCSNKLMTADMLAKPLPKPEFVKHGADLQLLPHAGSEIKGEY